MNAEIYTQYGCPHCVIAKRILTDRNIDYKEFTVGMGGITKATIEEKIGVGAKITTVPQIFLDGKYIGGCDDLKRHFSL